jgi:predicted Fe-Mo cluster-binding NifX family protein
MIAAITVWQHRVAPVFDAAHLVVLVDAENGAPLGEAALPAGDLAAMTDVLRRAGVAVVICGAISRAAGALLVNAGCSVMACVAGDLDEVVAALCSGALAHHALRLPPCPCCGHGQARQHKHRRGSGRRRPTAGQN